jgi:hypothetical protein
MDVFLLDVMTEFLDSPLRLLSYINRRVLYLEKVFAVHEITVLGYHLKNNLWLEDNLDGLFLSEDIAADIDTAMLVRRDGLPGDHTPDGILTRFEGTTFNKIINQIEKLEDPATIDLGFMILMLGEDTVIELNNGINHLAHLARKDNKHHDLTIGIGVGNTGLTIHCNNDPTAIAIERLKDHCERRKYTQKAESWFGICLRPNDISIRFGVELEYQWIKSEIMEDIVKDMPKGQKNINLKTVIKPRKIGRNNPCPCGSGKKYKRCCLRS